MNITYLEFVTETILLNGYIKEKGSVDSGLF
jgi:hypothetical protein